MPDNKFIIKEFFEREKDEIILLQEKKGLKASGKSAEGLVVEQHGDVTQLIDTVGTFEGQEFGVSPDEEQVDNLKLHEIYVWLQYKKYGFDWRNDTERWDMAENIFRKIKKRGTYTFINKKSTGVLTEALNAPSIDELVDELSDANSIEILTDITRILS